MAVGSPPLGAGRDVVVVGFGFGFVVAVGAGDAVAVEPVPAVVDGPDAGVPGDSVAVSAVEGVPPSGSPAVGTVAGVAAVDSVVRPACVVGFDPSEDAPAIPAPTRATTTQMRTWAHRGRARKRCQRFMPVGKDQP
jgi:hypothetical protein